MFDYFYGQSGEMFSYFRVPKILFRDIKFKDLSTDAKTLYGILLDRMSLSVKNGWTMDKLAEKADLSVNYVGDLERGVKTPSLDAFIRIVEALDVPADTLIRDTAAPASYVADDELNRKLSRLTPGQKKAATDILNAYIDNIPYIKEK